MFGPRENCAEEHPTFEVCKGAKDFLRKLA
jgi:hypothetical protein